MTQFDDIREMKREIRWLKNELAKRPFKTKGGSSSSVYTLAIVGGNTLSDGTTLGIKYSGSQITSVPSAYDPNVTSSFIDGIGRATLFVNGTAQSGFVLVVFDTRSSFSDALFVGDVCLASSSVAAIPVSGDPDGATVSCYIPLTP